MNWKTRTYAYGVIAAGAAVWTYATSLWAPAFSYQTLSYVICAAIAAALKVHLPGVSGTLSVYFVFSLLAGLQLGLFEAVLVGGTGALVQSFWKADRRTQLVQGVFNIAVSSLAASSFYFAYHAFHDGSITDVSTIPLLFAGCVFYVFNTLPIAGVLAIVEERQVFRLWQSSYFWSFPYYCVGSALTGLITAASRYIGWEPSLLVFPIVFLIYRSYLLYLARLEDQKAHAKNIADLHLRTIEALALAIEAKDDKTHDHLCRVRVYAVEIAKTLELEDGEIEALMAAALLHDIGKLAVPEQIISKPGKLTPEEFEKVKIHPIIGAEILERVQFPYPVAPIVRSHHEQWDGEGYPDGLKGEEIPIGARILAVVDCLDALTSDRNYRRAVALDEAMEEIRGRAGTSFDPHIVEVLGEHYKRLEEVATEQVDTHDRLPTDVQVKPGLAPAAGFAVEPGAVGAKEAPVDFLAYIASARQEFQMLFELTRDLGNSLSVAETLEVLTGRLERLVPHDACALYLRREGKLSPIHSAGIDAELLGSLEIPDGEGLTGWVAVNRKPICNGNPLAEPGYSTAPGAPGTLRSALAIPLEGPDGVVGVLNLYHQTGDAFTSDHLRILLAIGPKVALAIRNAVRFNQAASSATTDFLTGLPNARSLFLELDRQLSRASSLDAPLGVLVCDLDGFKEVNDTFGHLRGNEILKAVGSRLRRCCRPNDYVARMGGDEFVLLVGGSASIDVKAAVQRICETANRECKDLMVSLSIGAAYYPDDGSSAEQLLAEADLRMYKEKQTRREEAASATAAGGGSAPPSMTVN